MEIATNFLDVKLLRLLDLLYTTRSVSRSAQALGQSQSTVSMWLAKLREQLGDPLFVRTAQGMLPTPYTESLIETVREVLSGMTRLTVAKAKFDAAASHQRFAICMTDASHITLLPRLLARVNVVAPLMTLAASGIDDALANNLESGRADLALGFLPWLDTGFYQQTLYQQDWVCLVNANHPRITSQTTKKWNLEVYQREGHIGISAGTGYQLMQAAVANQRITRNIKLELPGFLGLSTILSTSNLVATLPRMIGETLAGSGKLRLMPCPFEIPSFTVKQYWHARFHHDRANQWLRGVCADLFIANA